MKCKSVMKKILFVLLLLMVFVDAEAQRKKKDTLNLCRPGSYVVFDLGGGLHTLNYDMVGYGAKNPGVGLTGRAGYRYFFGKGNFGAGLDLNFKTYSASGRFTYLNEIPNAVDEDYDLYTHRTYYKKLKEKQSEVILNVPLGVFYQQKFQRKFKLGGGLGIVYQAVIADKFAVKSGHLETTANYDVYNLELYGMSQHYEYTRDKSQLRSGDNGFKSSFGAFAEFDFGYVLTPRLDLNFGLYYVYGFKNQIEKSDKYQFDPDCMSPDAYKDVYNGVLNSRVVDKVTPLAIGVMAGIKYRLQKKEKQKPPVEKPEKRDTTTIPVIADVPVVDSVPQVVVVDTPPVIEENPPVIEENPPVQQDSVPTVVVVDNPPVIEDNPPVVEEKPVEKDSIPPVDSLPHIVIVDKPTDGIKEEIPSTDLVLRTFVAINFDYNQSFIRQRDNYYAFFNDIAKLAKENPDLKLKITGHTCDIGSESNNMTLGMKRAESAKKQLINRGVSADRITCETKGSTTPLYPNNSADNRAKNRRVEIKFLQ